MFPGQGTGTDLWNTGGPLARFIGDSFVDYPFSASHKTLWISRTKIVGKFIDVFHCESARKYAKIAAKTAHASKTEKIKKKKWKHRNSLILLKY